MQRFFENLDAAGPQIFSWILIGLIIGAVLYAVWWLGKAVRRRNAVREEVWRRQRQGQVARLGHIWDDPEWHTEGFDKKDVA